MTPLVVTGFAVGCRPGRPCGGRCRRRCFSSNRGVGAKLDAQLAFAIKRVSTVIPSPDGRAVAFVVADAVMLGEKSEWNGQIHVAKTDGSDAFQLTRSKNQLRATLVARRTVDWLRVVPKQEGQPPRPSRGRRPMASRSRGC